MKGATRIVLVDDHKLVTSSLKSFIETSDAYRVVGIASSGEELLRMIAEWMPDVVLQDLMLPGGIDGIETTARLMRMAPGVKVIALTASVDEARMMGVLRAGATGYVRKDAEPEILFDAIRSVLRNRTYIDPHVVRGVTAAQCGETPSTREHAVLTAIALGLSNKEIGSRLHVSEETVKTHVGSLLGKLGAANRAQAVVMGLRRGLLRLEELGEQPDP